MDEQKKTLEYIQKKIEELHKEYMEVSEDKELNDPDKLIKLIGIETKISSYEAYLDIVIFKGENL